MEDKWKCRFGVPEEKWKLTECIQIGYLQKKHIGQEWVMDGWMQTAFKNEQPVWKK